MANMSSETKQNGKKRMADDDQDRNEGNSREIAVPRSVAEKPTFFAIYKKGQGYWTRMLSAGGALLVLCLTAQFVYSHVLATVQSRDARLGAAVGVIVVGGIIAWY